MQSASVAVVVVVIVVLLLVEGFRFLPVVDNDLIFRLADGDGVTDDTLSQ